jgi:hypothetical protein
MKKLLIVLVAGSLSGLVGCATPAYSPGERNQQITRNQDYEGRQMVEDWDHFWMLNPPSRLTVWNVR